MNTHTLLSVKTDKKLKKDAQSIAKKLGVPLSTVINSFLKQFIRDEEVTFSAKTYQMTPYLEDLVAEARKERASKKDSESFSSAKEMIQSLEK